MQYEFRCVEHPDRKQIVVCPAKFREQIVPERCHICGAEFEQELKGSGGGWFKQTFGRLTGVYDYDYGRKATWDLTAPGKLEYCKKEGMIRDPFDSGPAPVINDQEL
jgi:hypothetical protein